MDMILSYRKYVLFSIIGLISILLVAYSLEGISMSLLNHPEEEVVVSSPMEGKITFNHAPAVGAKIERWLKWKDDVGETDTTITDENGNFSFPIIKDKVILSKISTFVMAQEIRVYFNGNEYPIWAKAKWDKGMYGELNGVPVNFRCELTDAFIAVEAGEGMLGTSCKWDKIKTKEEYND